MDNVDEDLKMKFYENGLIFKKTLEQIIEKYSKLQYQDRGIDVDLETTKMREMKHYMKLSKKKLTELDSKSLMDLREQSLRAQDITSNTQVYLSHEDDAADESCMSSTHFGVQDDAIFEKNNTEQTGSLSDERQRNISGAELQPEEEDEELENSLRSQGISLVELYPSIISQIGQAWHRQEVYNAADSVRRRYRRWRCLPSRSNLNRTFDVPLRDANAKPKKMNSKATSKKTFTRSPKRKLPETLVKRTETAPQVTNLQGWQAGQWSPDKKQGSLRRGQHQPVLVMDFSCINSSELENSKLGDVSTEQTFTVPEVSLLSTSSQPIEQPSAFIVSPTWPWYPTLKASVDSPLKPNWFSQSPRTVQKPRYPIYALETSAVTGDPSIHNSPVRQSPLKTHLMLRDHAGSPHALPRSPKPESAGSCCKKLRKSSLMAPFLSSPLSSSRQNPTVFPRRLFPQDSYHLFMSQLHSPQTASASSHHRPKRRLSFDSSRPVSTTSYSPKQLEDEFTKVYHKYVCLGKSSPSGPPCHMCARSSRASRGSKRQAKEMLQHRLSPSGLEASHYDLPQICSKHATAQRFTPQRPSREGQQEGWMSKGQPVHQSLLTSDRLTEQNGSDLFSSRKLLNRDEGSHGKARPHHFICH
ncbi:hypothetical protein LDENG_00052840 [Lucifuga dentata]|nr:hypothetical protein LDENG_00052840 [Lucifuga dentata]